MFTLAGDLPAFEEASRAFYAMDSGRFADLIRDWPADVRDYVLIYAQRAFDAAGKSGRGRGLHAKTGEEGA